MSCKQPIQYVCMRVSAAVILHDCAVQDEHPQLTETGSGSRTSQTPVALHTAMAASIRLICYEICCDRSRDYASLLRK
eukprot:331059-Chlamydomonas_euryale.AAC.8